ncbi:MAG: GAF domain-containing protein, partial [Ktedonobacteraceae bacterium]
MPGEDRLRTDADERARLQKALRESEILRELVDILNSSLDLEHILQALVRRTIELCEVARCAVWLLDEDSNNFRPVTYHVASPLLGEEIVQRASAIWYRTPLAADNPVLQRLLNAG